MLEWVKRMSSNLSKKTEFFIFFIPSNQIQAEDEDSDFYGDIVYSFSPGTDFRVKQIFSLDPDTGVMTLKSDLKDSGK